MNVRKIRPTSIEQREGRGIRQGNKNDEVAIYRYVTKQTFDAYNWSLVENKQRFISQVMTSKAVSRSCEDIDEAKKALTEAQERLNARCEQIKSQVSEIKVQVKSTAKNIVDETKAKGRAALYRVTEFVGIKKRLLNVRTAVKDMIVSTDRDIARTALLAKGLREAGQTVNNAFHTFADKPEVDYSQKEQKHPFTKAVLAPMKAVKKLLVSMELHLDASIDKLDNLAMNVQFDKEKRMEQTKDKEQKAPDTEREIIYSPMVAEPQEYKYNADAFAARKTSEAKQETAGKELPKVREDKAR